MRLGPLLIVVIAAWIAIKWLAGSPIPLSDITGGVLFPTWPFGTWSITIELHFYLLFPLLLFLFRRRQVPFLLLAVVAGAILARFDWWCTFGEAQHIAYWTVVGRVDQFVLGSIRCTSSQSCCAIFSGKAAVVLTISSRR